MLAEFVSSPVHVNFNHCAGFVSSFALSTKPTDSSSNIQEARAHAASGVHHTPEFNVAFQLACSSTDVGLLSSCPSSLVLQLVFWCLVIEPQLLGLGGRIPAAATSYEATA